MGMYGDIISGLITIAGTLLGIVLKDRLEKKKKGLDLNTDFALKSKISPILEEIRYELDADRVQYWVFSNGDVTLTGHHLKKVSIFEEANKEGNQQLAHLFQLVPTKNFERTFNQLHESHENFIVSQEDDYNDDLSDIYKLYDARTLLHIKLTKPGDKWVGIISIWFNKRTEIPDQEISFAKLQSSRIGAIK